MGKKSVRKENPYINPVQKNVYYVPFEQIQLISIHGQTVTGRLLISNDNEVPINFRILAPKTTRLQVSPQYGMVHPRNFQVILVTLTPSNDITDVDFFKRNYQLLIQVLESYHVDLPDIIEMFNNKPEIKRRLQKWNKKVARSPRFPKPENAMPEEEILSDHSTLLDIDNTRHEEAAKEKYINNFVHKKQSHHHHHHHHHHQQHQPQHHPKKAATSEYGKSSPMLFEKKMDSVEVEQSKRLSKEPSVYKPLFDKRASKVFKQTGIMRQKHHHDKHSVDRSMSFRLPDNDSIINPKTAAPHDHKKGKGHNALSYKSIEKILKNKKPKGKKPKAKKYHLTQSRSSSFFGDSDYVMKPDSNYFSRNASFNSVKSSFKESVGTFQTRESLEGIVNPELPMTGRKSFTIPMLKDILINFFLRLFNWRKASVHNPENKNEMPTTSSAVKRMSKTLTSETVSARDITEGKMRPESRLFHDKDTRHYHRRRSSIMSVVDREHRMSMQHSRLSVTSTAGRADQRISLFQPVSGKKKRKTKKKKKRKRRPQTWRPKACKSFNKRIGINLPDLETPEKELLQYQDLNTVKVTEPGDPISMEDISFRGTRRRRKLSDVLVDLLKIRNKLNQPYGDDVKQPVNYFARNNLKCSKHDKNIFTKEAFEKNTVNFVSKIYKHKPKMGPIKTEEWTKDELKQIPGLPCAPLIVTNNSGQKSRTNTSSITMTVNTNNLIKRTDRYKGTSSKNTTSKLFRAERTSSSSVTSSRLQESRLLNSSNSKPELPKRASIFEMKAEQRASMHHARPSMLLTKSSDMNQPPTSKTKVTKKLFKRFEGKKPMNHYTFRMKPMDLYSDKSSITRCTNNKNAKILLRGYNYMMDNIGRNPLATNPITLTRVYEYTPPGLDMRPNMIKCTVDSCDIFNENCDYLHRNPVLRDYNPTVYTKQAHGFTTKNMIPFTEIEGLENSDSKTPSI